MSLIQGSAFVDDVDRRYNPFLVPEPSKWEGWCLTRAFLPNTSFSEVEIPDLWHGTKLWFNGNSVYPNRQTELPTSVYEDPNGPWSAFKVMGDENSIWTQKKKKKLDCCNRPVSGWCGRAKPVKAWPILLGFSLGFDLIWNWNIWLNSAHLSYLGHSV